MTRVGRSRSHRVGSVHGRRVRTSDGIEEWENAKTVEESEAFEIPAIDGIVLEQMWVISGLWSTAKRVSLERTSVAILEKFKGFQQRCGRKVKSKSDRGWSGVTPSPALRQLQARLKSSSFFRRLHLSFH
jgi:hypothetical protein